MKNWKTIVQNSVKKYGSKCVIEFCKECDLLDGRGLNGKLTDERLEQSKFWENQSAAVINMFDVPEKFRPSARGVLRYAKEMKMI